MEFGWYDSEVKSAAMSDHFPTFLQKMLAAWPDGPGSLHFEPFVANCDFVGRAESMSDDLREALSHAGERFDDDCMNEPRHTESSIARIKNACKAPRPLLEAIMNAEAKFNGRFGYDAIPEHLIGEADSAVWPMFAVRAQDDAANAQFSRAREMKAVCNRYDYRLVGGESIEGDQAYERIQCGLIGAIEGLSSPQGKRAAVFASFDPYFAYLLKGAGYASVTFVHDNSSVLPQKLIERIDLEIECIDYRRFWQSATHGTYDVVVLVDTLDYPLTGDTDLAKAAFILKPGGELVATAPMHAANPLLPLKTFAVLAPDKYGLLPPGYYNIAYLDQLLASFNMSRIDVCDRFDDAIEVEQYAEWQRAFTIDPGELFSRIVFTSRKAEVLEARGSSDVQTGFFLRHPMELLQAPRDALAKSWQHAIATLQFDLAAEQARRASAEQGFADRQAELIDGRIAIARQSILIDALKDELQHLRNAHEKLRNQYQTLDGSKRTSSKNKGRKCLACRDRRLLAVARRRVSVRLGWHQERYSRPEPEPVAPTLQRALDRRPACDLRVRMRLMVTCLPAVHFLGPLRRTHQRTTPCD